MAMTTSVKSPWVTDVEVYPNYCLIGFKHRETGKVVSVEIYGEKTSFSKKDRDWLKDFMERKFTIGFNSISYDLAIIYAAIAGYTAYDLYLITDDIIAQKIKHWVVAEEWGYKIPRWINHVDLIEVAPGKASLKIYNGRLHGKLMRDLPIEPGTYLTEEEADTVYEYWRNDLQATIDLWDALKNQIELRAAMSEEFGTDLRSKSDAQVAEAVIKAEIERLTGYKVQKPKNQKTKFYYNPPKYLRFKNDQINDILDRLEDIPIRVNGVTGKVLMPDFLANAEIKIGKGVYRMGIGGLHSSETCQHVEADDEYVLIDRDVASYYPAIIISLGLAPDHLGWAFLKVYKNIVARRLKEKGLAKDAKKFRDTLKEGSPEWGAANETYLQHQTAADSLKITINGSFGKLGSMYSILFSPNLLIQTTVTGQLALLLLIEWLEEEGIQVVSANTDGIVIRCHKSKIDLMNEVVADWEAATKFETEATEYSHLYSRDVNNYIAVKADGSGVKTKGAYAIPEPGKPPLLQKNPTNEIAIRAVIEHITKGTSLTKTIRECEDIRQFLTVRTVQGGGIWDTGRTVDEGEYLGKAIRWYYGAGLDTHIVYKKPNAKGNHNRVPKSEGAKPCMTLPDAMPDDVNYGWYIKEAQSILQDIGFHDDLIGKPVRKKKVVDEDTDETA